MLPAWWRGGGEGAAARVRVGKAPCQAGYAHRWFPSWGVPFVPVWSPIGRVAVVLSTYSCGLAVARTGSFLPLPVFFLPHGLAPSSCRPGLPHALSPTLCFHGRPSYSPGSGWAPQPPWAWEVLNDCVPQALWRTVSDVSGRAPTLFSWGPTCPGLMVSD